MIILIESYNITTVPLIVNTILLFLLLMFSLILVTVALGCTTSPWCFFLLPLLVTADIEFLNYCHCCFCFFIVVVGIFVYYFILILSSDIYSACCWAILVIDPTTYNVYCFLWDTSNWYCLDICCWFMLQLPFLQWIFLVAYFLAWLCCEPMLFTVMLLCN